MRQVAGRVIREELEVVTGDSSSKNIGWMEGEGPLCLEGHTDKSKLFFFILFLFLFFLR